MQAIQSGIQAAGAIPNGGSYKGFGFPGESFNESLNLPFGYSGAPPPTGQLTVPGVGLENVQRSNNYIGLPSFDTVPTAYLALVNRNDLASREDTRSLSVGQIAFARSSDDNVLSRLGKAVPTYGVTPGQNSAEFKSLTSLNSFLRGAGRALYSSAKQITAEWHLIGVFKNEVAPSNSWTLGAGRYVNRIINIIVSHRVAVLNYWVNSYGFYPGSHLFLIVRQEEQFYQIVPYSSPNYNYPPDSEIRGGEVIYFGKADDYFRSAESGHARLSESLISQNLLSTVQVYVGV